MTPWSNPPGARDFSSDKPEWFLEEEVFSTDGTRLAQVLEGGWDTKDNWFENELGAIMDHQWAAPLELDVAPVSAPESGTEPQQKVLHTLRDMMLNASGSLELLRSTVEFAASQIRGPGGSLPPDIARVLYYACVLVARCQYDEPLEDLKDADLLAGVDWVRSRTWLSAEIKRVFGQYRDRLESLHPQT